MSQSDLENFGAYQKARNYWTRRHHPQCGHPETRLWPGRFLNVEAEGNFIPADTLRNRSMAGAAR